MVSQIREVEGRNGGNMYSKGNPIWLIEFENLTVANFHWSDISSFWYSILCISEYQWHKNSLYRVFCAYFSEVVSVNLHKLHVRKDASYRNSQFKEMNHSWS